MSQPFLVCNMKFDRFGYKVLLNNGLKSLPSYIRLFKDKHETPPKTIGLFKDGQETHQII